MWANVLKGNTKWSESRELSPVGGESTGSPIERISIHDKYQFEVKRSYLLGHHQQTRFELYTYVFLPNTLDVSSRTYAPADFYRNVQNYVRLRTPRLSFEEIGQDERSPLVLLERLASETRNESKVSRIVANLKLLHPVTKTALNDFGADALERREELAHRTEEVLDFLKTLLSRLRSVKARMEGNSSAEVLSALRLMDEAMSLLAEQTLLDLYQALDESECSDNSEGLRSRIREFAAGEHEHRSALRDSVGAPPMAEEELLDRLSLLKKYSSQVLYLRTERKPEGKAVEHLVLAIAAGLAMSFATMVTFYSQLAWHAFSLKLFVAFVAGYMFKDRIKEIVRGWLSSGLNKRLDDHRLLLYLRGGAQQIGYIRERVRFAKEVDVPNDVLEKRRCWTEAAVLDDLAVREEKVLVHRREVVLTAGAREAIGEQAPSDGISDIARFDIRPFLAKMDDPKSKRRRFRGDRVETARYRRSYPIYVITAAKAGSDGSVATVSVARIQLTRKGILSIEEGSVKPPPGPTTH